MIKFYIERLRPHFLLGYVVGWLFGEYLIDKSVGFFGSIDNIAFFIVMIICCGVLSLILSNIQNNYYLY